jgi:hypothetical protein
MFNYKYYTDLLEIYWTLLNVFIEFCMIFNLYGVVESEI